MAGGALYTEAEDRALLEFDTLDAYNQWARMQGLPERGYPGWKRRRGQLRAMHHRGAAAQAMQAASTWHREPEHGDDDYEALFASLEQAAAARDALEEPHVTAEHDLGDLPVGLVALGDIHAGARIDYARLRADLETIRATDGLYAIGMGDYIENTKPSLKSATALYSAVFASPKEQLEYVRRRLGICREKWLGLLGGNHDAFDYRTAGIDRIAGLAESLGVPYYGEAGATLALTVGSERYIVVAKHQYTGQSRINKSNSARRLWDEWPWEWENADVILLAHLHECDTHVTRRKGRPVAYLRSGTYKVHDAYAESLGFVSGWGLPLVVLYPDSRAVVPFDGAHFHAGLRFLAGERARYGARVA